MLGVITNTKTNRTQFIMHLDVSHIENITYLNIYLFGLRTVEINNNSQQNDTGKRKQFGYIY